MIDSALQYLKISIPMVPPMAVLVIMRNALQGMKHLVMPLVCSGLELLGKVNPKRTQTFHKKNRKIP